MPIENERKRINKPDAAAAYLARLNSLSLALKIKKKKKKKRWLIFWRSEEASGVCTTNSLCAHNLFKSINQLESIRRVYLLKSMHAPTHFFPDRTIILFFFFCFALRYLLIKFDTCCNWSRFTIAFVSLYLAYVLVLGLAFFCFGKIRMLLVID